MRKFTRWLGVAALSSLLFSAVLVSAQDATPVPTDPAMEMTAEPAMEATTDSSMMEMTAEAIRQYLADKRIAVELISLF